MKLTNSELSSFCEQMAMILHSGISSLEGISIMRDTSESKEAQEVFDKIYQELEASGNVTHALTESGVFPQYLLDMVNIGEQAGKLDTVMGSLAVYYRRQENIASNIRSAITYPLVMIGMMLVVILVLITRVMPIFNQVFVSLGSEMTGISKGILNIGTWLSRYSLVFLIIAAILILLLVYMFKTQRGKALASRWAGRFFFTKGLYQAIAVSRFADGMSLTLSSGLDSDQSLDMVTPLVNHQALQDKLALCKEEIASGADLGSALRKAEIFDGLYARMVTVGVSTGSLDDVMRKVADQYEEDIDERVNRKVAMLEPTLVAILSVLVGMILLSVMLPLMGIMSNIG